MVDRVALLLLRPSLLPNSLKVSGRRLPEAILQTVVMGAALVVAVVLLAGSWGLPGPHIFRRT